MLDFSNTTKQDLPLSQSLLEKIANDILDTSYNVSIVVVGEKRAQALNKEYRNKDYTPNVLSFPLDETTGEIFLNPKTARIEAPKFNLDTNQYLYYLIIHSMLHLKGFDHSDEMSEQENFFMKKYFDIETNF
jgi:probable rRNA maturation factor